MASGGRATIFVYSVCLSGDRWDDANSAVCFGKCSRRRGDSSPAVFPAQIRSNECRWPAVERPGADSGGEALIPEQRTAAATGPARDDGCCCRRRTERQAAKIDRRRGGELTNSPSPTRASEEPGRRLVEGTSVGEGNRSERAMPWCCGGSSGPPPPPPATVSSAPRRGLSRAKKPSAAEASAARPTTSGSATVALSGDADDDFDAGNRRQLPLAPPDLYGPMLLRPQKPALHVTANGSSGVEGTFVETLRQNGWSVHASSALLAPTDFERLRPVLVLLDLRLPDVADLSRTLRLLPHSDDVFFAVLYDRSISEKRRKALCQQTDVHHVISASSADIGLCDLFARLSTRLRAVPALFAVVEEADQPIEICDERNIVQYVNRAYESATGCVRDEVLGTPSSDLRRKSLRPRDLESNENLAAQGAAPSGGFQANHRRRSSEWHCITVPTSAFSSQYVYVKRGSTDAMICRDISLKSLRSQSALVDAPISEVISMLREASARCEELETQQTLREVLRMLQSSELYAPSITRFSYNDRISSGYYDGLIRLHHPSRQRKRSVVDALREKPRQGVAVEPRRRISADVKNALENEGSWSFNVLELERVSEHHPLVHLGTKLFDRWKVGETLQCSPETISKWLHMIEEHYHAGNSYHNASHAADVLQATSYFLERDRVAQHVLDTHAVAALVAATVHDLDHPGRGNAYLINTRSPLALLYNDVSVLENHHVALAFQLTLQPSLNANIFERLSRDEFTAMRQAIVEMVLATDMSRHFEFLTKFQQTVFEETGDPEERGLNSLTVCRMLIKCADIANPTRDWSLCQKWASRIVEEYFSQTAEELEKKLPVTMGLFDRRSCNVPETQSGFIKMFARETFTTWCEFAECPRLLVHLEENFKNWERLSEHWDTSLNEKIAEVTFDAP